MNLGLRKQRQNTHLTPKSMSCVVLGLKICPSISQTTVSDVLREHSRKRCYAIINEVIIFGKNENEPLGNLQKKIFTV